MKFKLHLARQYEELIILKARGQAKETKEEMKGYKRNLLKESPATTLGVKFDQSIPMSLEASGKPASAISASMHPKSSFTEMCLTFSAIAPTA